MRKLVLIIGISLLLLTPAVCASRGTTLRQRHQAHHMTADGNFTGIFAMKNDTGYIPLGTMSGTYSVNNGIGTFQGLWSMDNGSASGTFQGWIVSQVFLGQMNTTGGNSSYFLGLTRVNETDNSFVAVSIIFNQQQYVIRYAMGNL